MSSPPLQAVTTDISQIASLYDLTFTGLATQEGTSCRTSCPADDHMFVLTFYVNDGRTVNVRVAPFPAPCGGVNIEGTNCTPHPDDLTAILSQITSILALDAGGSGYCSGG